jgi:branched-chain amino acid transport system substrate-binding protein
MYKTISKVRQCKTIALLLTLIMVSSILVSGCGKKNGAAAKQTVIKIGVLAPYTGPASRVGQEFKDTTTMAFAEHGNKIGDKKIQLVWIDESNSDAQKSADNYEQAIVRDNIDVGFAGWHSWDCAACMDITAKYKVPNFFSMGGVELINQKYKSNPDKYIYWGPKSWPTPSKLVTGYVQTIQDAIKKGTWTPRNKKVAIYGVNNDWGRSVGNALKSQFTAAGWQVVDEEWVGLGETEFYPLLKKIQSKDASVVAGTMSDPPSISSFIKQSNELGLKSFMVSDGLGWVGEWYKLTGAASNGVLDMIPQFTPKADKFRADFKAKYGYEPAPAPGSICYDMANYLYKILDYTNTKYGTVDRVNITKVMKDEVYTGKLTYKDGLMMPEYKYTPQTWPDPVVDQNHYVFPVIQYENGKGNIVWPASLKQADVQLPASLK